MKNVEICFSPVLYPYYAENNDHIAVIVDIFRATTTMCAAFNNGVQSIIPVATIEEAQAYKVQGFLTGAERNVKRCDFADFGNSPFDYTREKVEGQEIVFTTTNGTMALKTAENAYGLVIGAFSNISAVTDYCINAKKDVIIVCSGWNNRFNLEDSLYAGALVDMLMDKGAYMGKADAVDVALGMWGDAKADIRSYINKSEHISRLIANKLEDSVDYCLTLDTVSLVPIYDKVTGKLSI